MRGQGLSVLPTRVTQGEAAHDPYGTFLSDWQKRARTG